MKRKKKKSTERDAEAKTTKRIKKRKMKRKRLICLKTNLQRLQELWIIARVLWEFVGMIFKPG
jgi:hypothetical protein